MAAGSTSSEGTSHKKLFIPGPTEVRPEIRAKLSLAPIGHRAPEFSELFNSITSKLQRLLYTQNQIFLSTSSGTGLMEAGIRNCVEKKCLNATCGAFSERWHKIALDNGKQADTVSVEWGKANTPELIDEKLSSGEYDALCFTHNETSTGVTNPLYEVAEVVKKYPDVIFMVDAVSSMSGVKIEVDKLGIDLCLASVQKCLALPPGFSVCSVSQKALNRAEKVPHRGHYFDFLALLKKAAKGQTPTTPSIPHMYALDSQLDAIFAEGLENRFERHRRMADMVRSWASKSGFEMFSQEGYRSNTVSCMRNNKGINVAALNSELAKKNMLISNGYGILKEKAFRIAHMGELTPVDIEELLQNIDEILERTGT